MIRSCCFKRLAALGALAISVYSCGEDQEARTYAVLFEATNDSDEPVSGVAVSAGGNALGQTNERGELATTLSGSEGQQVRITSKCPEGNARIGEAPTLVLRRFEGVSDGKPSALRYSIQCKPTNRLIALVARASEQVGLPLLVDGEPYGTLDRSGAFHATFRRPPGTSLRVTLDTGAHPDLRPQSPMRIFNIRDSDELLLFVQKFQKVKKPKPKRRRVKQLPRRLPVRIH